MGDDEKPQLRERLWIRKMDHTTDPPTLVEEIFIEDGERKAPPEEQQKEESDAK